MITIEQGPTGYYTVRLDDGREAPELSAEECLGLLARLVSTEGSMGYLKKSKMLQPGDRVCRNGDYPPTEEQIGWVQQIVGESARVTWCGVDEWLPVVALRFLGRRGAGDDYPVIETPISKAVKDVPENLTEDQKKEWAKRLAKDLVYPREVRIIRGHWGEKTWVIKWGWQPITTDNPGEDHKVVKEVCFYFGQGANLEERTSDMVRIFQILDGLTEKRVDIAPSGYTLLVSGYKFRVHVAEGGRIYAITIVE